MDQIEKKGVSRRQFIGGLLGVTAVGATGASGWALKRFVIDDVAVANVSAYEAANGVALVSSGNGTVTADSYSSDAASIKIKKVAVGSGNSTVTFFVADIVLTQAAALASAFANDEFGQNIVENTSEIASANDAIFAVNGDYYGFRTTGITIRNGVKYRDEGAREGLAFYKDGHIEVYDETATNADELIDNGVWNTLSFGPAMIKDSVIQPDLDTAEVDTNFGNHGITGSNPRTAIGVLGDNHIAVVVVDGRSTGYSKGFELSELAAVMKDLGCVTAYNLDGGGSSTMYFNGAVVNNPQGKGQERGVSDILYIKK